MQTDGLFDLQVNGYAGVDFNDISVTPAAMDRALEAMLADGVTGCLPTLITATAEDLRARFDALDAAVRASRLGPLMVPGYHLEGPFLNAGEGYHGCHPAAAMCDPSVVLVSELEARLSRPILLVTLAPERAGAAEAVRKLAASGKIVAMAHSAAGFADVRAAADAGLSVSTHLGNGLPQLLPKLDNTLLAQLAEPRLAACLIADGHHIPPDALRALVSLKGPENCVLVSDAVVAAAMSPGDYRFAGMEVRLTEDGRVVQPSGVGLAGSALRLDQAVRNLADWSIADPEAAAAMAGPAARKILRRALVHHRITLGPGRLAWDDALRPRVVEMPTVQTA
ncbi:N-acetylglucosamine-6-phosphate deacetylase [Palleronia pelagia]|uniref:N-acetylglucosamine-6-phosphate deacetylase n=1 Tax=Palleronia pelagia TaxID=387096 RepID=A0A1H8AM69_9RHOB|nr:N-acetylglucosamine-6-phosphate deacetylase [Palleronia pelagia]SEM71084.1 N-acetylglucosamine-6-phosphate deacetylase [Palleronia pelagia]